MKRVTHEVARVLAKTSAVRETRRSGKAVKEVLQRIHTALARNPEFSPFGPIPYGEKQPGAGGAGSGERQRDGRGAAADRRDPSPRREEAEKPPKPSKPRKRNPLLKRLTRTRSSSGCALARWP